MLVGEPYALPYRQSFANQNQGGHILIMYVGAGMNAGFTTFDTFDNDNGAVSFNATTPSQTLVVFGKVAATSTTSPVMKFYYKAPTDVPARLSVNFQSRYFIPQLKIVADEAMEEDQQIIIDNFTIGSLADGISIVDNKTDARRYNVFTTDGRQVLLQAETLRGLRPGVYVINGRTTIVR